MFPATATVRAPMAAPSTLALLCEAASHWAFVFGPSISIGNIGVNF
jgi:hypothetical protein